MMAISHILAAVAACTLAFGEAEALREPHIDDFDWSSITPAENISYHDCYERFKCARLQVPLDWLNKSDSRYATIAMIKLPAVVGDDDQTFGGSIFTNPGGPGGSGVQQVLGLGQRFQKLAALEGKRNYEIVSFDPRGVGLTQPTSDCFHTDMVGRDAFVFEARGVGRLDGGRHAVPYRLAMEDGFGNRCLAAEEAYGDGMAYVNTPSVARDMVAMIDKIDELRKGNRVDRDDDRVELRKRSISSENNKSGDLPRLQYMGFSYGTILGNYFATLFPGRVGRLLLDGVDNADDYAKGPGWLTNLEDTDKIFDTFFEGCFNAGPSVCPLLRKEDVSAADTKTRVWSWINHLSERPQSALDASGLPVVISAIDVLSMVGGSFYDPTPSFRQMARIIDESMRGNYTELISQLKNNGLPATEDACALNPGHSIKRPEAQSAILCGDGDDISDKEVPWWEDYISQQVNTSKVYGAYWSNIRLACARWPFSPNWSFKGPFSTPEPATAQKPLRNQPSAPILFFTNRLDPVTPLSAARAMAKYHPGSRLVILEASGHCALYVPVTNSCMKDIMAEYFYSGKVPKAGETICDGACDPWDKDCTFNASESLFATTSQRDVNDQWWRRRFPLAMN